ncbi:MAG TPA: hypothetical protein VFG07_07250 [Thermoplasmata archaeon]|nr:hypothetical protein [Thermoplasmata archaeon]
MREAQGLLSESDRPLGYLAAVITILGIAAAIAYSLSRFGADPSEASAFGGLLALLGLGGFYLVASISRSARLRHELDASRRDSSLKDQEISRVQREASEAKLTAEAVEKELREQVTNTRREAAEDRRRLEDRLHAAEDRIVSLTAEAGEAKRMAESERHSTERAKIAPAMDPYYRFEGHLIRADHRWVGVRNLGLGPAEEVTIALRFSSPTGQWDANRRPYVSVLPAGEKAEFELDSSHFTKDPKQLDITVEYTDLVGLHHVKSVTCTL